jgi:acetyl-CoA synthetase
MPDFPFGQDFAWHPDPAAVQNTNLARFWEKQGLGSYEALQRWALEDVGRFWEAALEDLGVEFYEDYEQIVDPSDGPEMPRWCVGGKMNAAHNMLDRWMGTEAEGRDAVRYESEEGDVRTLTYGELKREVDRCAAAMRTLGLGKGDRIGLYGPMTPELVIAFLATVKLGGVVLPLFSGYGAEAVRTRLADGEARALFCADGLVRRGRKIPMKPTADEAIGSVPSVEFVFLLPRTGDEVPMMRGRDRTWAELMALADDAPAERFDTEKTGAEDPVMLIYTSGTTGRPKGAVHTHCGFPIKGAQDMRHAMDVRPGDVVWWMSDLGWMMGPWLIFGTLLCGATMVLFDGAPDAAEDGGQDVGRSWGVCARHGVTLFGLSPTLVRALMPNGAEPVRKHDLSALRACGSTGSPWDPESWKWLFETVLDGGKPILNYSGGTEISGGIVCGNMVEPIKPCGFPGPVVGMDADVVGADGEPVRGEVGELVIRQPWIGMTRGFWQDEQRYHDSYWAQRPGVWTHGDFAAVDRDGQWFLLGRSDDTIKVAGKRLGPAEVEAVLNAHPAVVESAAIGVPHPVKGDAVVAFVVTREAPGEADEALRKELIARLVDALGKALKPQAVLFASALPKTRNGKVMRRLIRAAHLGTDTGDATALEAPETLDAVRSAA